MLFRKMFLWILAAAVITVTDVYAEAPPEENMDYEFQYVLMEDGNAKITGYTGHGQNLVIPSEIDGHPVKVIGEYAFRFADALDIVIAEGIEVIEDGAFCFCSDINSVQLPKSLKEIGSYVFENAYFISAKVYIPRNVCKVGSNPFDACANLWFIEIDDDHPYLAVVDGVLFSKPDKRLICYPCALRSATYTVPQGIKVIGGRAFQSSSRLSSLILPDSIEVIEESAFAECRSLTGMMIPESVREIQPDAFSMCDSLILTVQNDSAAYQYCIENDVPYSCTKDLDWLE